MYTLRSGKLVASGFSGGPSQWTFSNGTLVSPPLVSQGTVYGAAGKVFAVNGGTGATVWTGTAGPQIVGPSEAEGDDLPALAIGDGLLAVPAGPSLTVFGS